MNDGGKKIKVLYLPNAVHTERVFTEAAFARLNRDFDVTRLATGAQDCLSEQVAEAIPGMDALITGWGTPVLTAGVFERADRLRIIAHSAGTVKRMLLDCARDYVIPRGICVYSANAEIAYNAAEHALGLMILMLRRILDTALTLRGGERQWPDRMVRPNAQYLTGATVGIVSASQVGRRVISLLKPFNTRVLVFDPYLTQAEAELLGVEKVSLLALFGRADIVSVHAPLLPDTVGMIGSAHFAAMRDGAVLVNTSRGKVLDEPALVAELRSGRITAALDVSSEEPLPPDSPLLALGNVLITPHLAGSGYYGYARIGEGSVRALEDFFAGRPVAGAVDFARYDIIA
jgi:phosphoglycerate dehydrogenase-like enzyme